MQKSVRGQIGLVGQLVDRWAESDFDGALAWLNQLPVETDGLDCHWLEQAR